jgi:endoglucanase
VSRALEVYRGRGRGRRRLSSRAEVLLVALVAAIPLMAGGYALLPDGTAPPADARHETLARGAASDFIARYIDGDGRVVRHDQGGDTVSEGQSYALLLAQVAGRDDTFARVLDWTRSHLQQPGGLLASHADAGSVLDRNPASDGDLVTAWALARSAGPRADAHRREARRIAEAVLERELVGALLAAGPWATGSPATLNPSYWVLPAFEALRGETGVRRWDELASASLTATRALTEEGRLLPPDWARLDGSTVSATPSPNGDPPVVQYGPDAQRLVVWLAAACDPAARGLAGSFWPLLSDPARGQALALSTDGEVVNGAPSVLALVATSAAAGAAGHPGERDRLLARASRLDAQQPTYYGSAWLALGRALLTTDSMGGCAARGDAE